MLWIVYVVNCFNVTIHKWLWYFSDKEQPSSSTSKAPSSSATYDDIYFDSDEDNDGINLIDLS